MIVFDLSCSLGHRFEGWFGSSGDFDEQMKRGLLACPHCGSVEVSKAPMAPAVPRKGNQKADLPAETAVRPEPTPEMIAAMHKLASLQAEMLKESQWVGKDFADKSRAMHYGETEHRMIHGQASIEEAKQLHEEGIAVAPLLIPVAPPEDIN